MEFEIKEHVVGDKKIGEIVSDVVVIQNIEDGIDLVGNTYYAGCDAVILAEKQITVQFFDLSTKMAGEILQKFSNYRMQLAIVGTFEVKSDALRSFIVESNRTGKIIFTSSVEEAINKLS